MSPDPDNTPNPDPKPEDTTKAPDTEAEAKVDTEVDAAAAPNSPAESESAPDPIPNPKPDPTSKPTSLKSGFTSAFEDVLKDPRKILQRLRDQPGYHLTAQLALTALACLLGFGFVVGTMSGGEQLWAAPLKVAGGVLASALICYPSLYIFSCLTGLDLRPGTLAGLLSACVCLAALLLVGFAPVAWLFAQSTDSTLFYGILCLAIWGTALYFGLGLFRQIADHFAITKRHHLYVWASIFALVTIQMSTSLRPIIGTAPTFLPGEKKFFLEHWFGEINTAGKRTAEGKFSIPKTADAHTDDPELESDGWK